MGQENAVKSDEDLYRELKWLLPTTSLDIYVTAGTWQRDLLLVDLELIKAHRREAGAPEVAPVDLKKVLPELQGRHIKSHPPEAPAPLAPPAPPAPPPAPHVLNAKEAPPRTQYVSTSTASFRNLPPRYPPNPPSKGVVKDAVTKTSVSRLAGSFALGKRPGSAPSNRVPNSSVPKAGARYGTPSAANRRLAYGEHPASVRRTDRPVVTEEVKSVHGSYKNGQEALSRPPYVSTSTASVPHVPPRNPPNPPSKGVVKDPITKGSVRLLKLLIACARPVTGWQRHLWVHVEEMLRHQKGALCTARFKKWSCTAKECAARFKKWSCTAKRCAAHCKKWSCTTKRCPTYFKKVLEGSVRFPGQVPEGSDAVPVWFPGQVPDGSDAAGQGILTEIRGVTASRDKRAATEECIRSKTIDGEAEQSQDHPEQEAAAGGVVGINTKPIVLNTETNSMQIILAWLPQMLCFFFLQQLQIPMNIAVFSSKML
ncbi:unnamed protein product [Cladocopium goreaui]|uniref:Uncharacterized protein n=1 Tax=Cladocopium goreaui TaxID=2562237 RepID=A0A9P1FPV9_9DINO|nr:unnamed protein product [Cladocopium goreaui]